MLKNSSFLNPLHYVSANAYTHFWTILFNSALKGIGAILLSIICFIISLWFQWRKEDYILFIVFFGFALFFAYAGSIMSVL